MAAFVALGCEPGGRILGGQVSDEGEVRHLDRSYMPMGGASSGRRWIDNPTKQLRAKGNDE